MQSNRKIQYQPRNLVRRDSTQSTSASAYNFNHFDGEVMIKGQQMGPESVTLEYKDYTYPWDHRKKSTLTECICAFLNTEGGTILIGIKETQNYKRTVKGYHYKEDEIQQLHKDITLLVQNISKMVVVNNLVKVKMIPVVKPNSNRGKTNYVVKITVEKGWLENYQRVYDFNGNYFFRTQNEVKCYNEQVDLDDIRNWRMYKEMQERQKELKRQQEIERLILLQKTNKVIKPKMRSVSIQTDPVQVPRREQPIQEQRSEGMRILRVENDENRVPLMENKRRGGTMDCLSKLWRKFKSFCD